MNRPILYALALSAFLSVGCKTRHMNSSGEVQSIVESKEGNRRALIALHPQNSNNLICFYRIAWNKTDMIYRSNAILPNALDMNAFAAEAAKQFPEQNSGSGIKEGPLVFSHRVIKDIDSSVAYNEELKSWQGRPTAFDEKYEKGILSLSEIKYQKLFSKSVFCAATAAGNREKINSQIRDIENVILKSEASSDREKYMEIAISVCSQDPDYMQSYNPFFDPYKALDKCVASKLRDYDNTHKNP